MAVNPEDVPFVVTVNPKDVQYNRESVLLCHHKAQGPPKCHKSCLLASHDTQAMAREQAAYSFHLPVRTPLPTPLQCVLPTPSCPISCSDVPSICYSSQLSKHHRLSPLQSCPHSPLDSLSHSHQNTYPDDLPTTTVVTPISTMAQAAGNRTRVITGQYQAYFNMTAANVEPFIRRRIGFLIQVHGTFNTTWGNPAMMVLADARHQPGRISHQVFRQAE